MTVQHLIENAHLDALGLLDEQELAAYNAAFAAAPPALQEHIRREQARWANVDFLLPRVEPPEDLRARVLAAVGEAMIASEVLGESDSLTLRPSKRVARQWRTAAVGLFAGCVVLGAAFINVRQLNEGMRLGMSNTETRNEIFTGLGGTQMNDTFFSADTRRVQFIPVVAGFDGQASVLVHPGWDVGQFAYQKLPPLSGATYHLALLDDDGEVKSRITNLGAGGKDLNFVALPASVVRAGTRLALISIADGAANATILMTARV